VPVMPDKHINNQNEVLKLTSHDQGTSTEHIKKPTQPVKRCNVIGSSVLER